jgi:hypothetical protein
MKIFFPAHGYSSESAHALPARGTSAKAFAARPHARVTLIVRLNC